MAIAIIGWGSLIWDLEILAPHVSGDWQMEAGPRLPMEFSRISPKRKMGLVVCLDPVVGVDCPTHVIASAKPDIKQAHADLAARERAPLNLIGGVHKDGFTRGRMPSVIDRVADWCEQHGWDGAVWTDLEPNFIDHTNQVFSITAGIAYLETLGPDSLPEAHRYIQNAPKQTKTPLRVALQRNNWWKSLFS